MKRALEGAQALADLAAPKAALAALRDDVLSCALEAACRSALTEQPGAPPAACHRQLFPANAGRVPAWKALADHLSSGCDLRVRKRTCLLRSGAFTPERRCLAPDVALR